MEQDKVDTDAVMVYVYAAYLRMAQHLSESNVKHIVETLHIVVHAHKNHDRQNILTVRENCQVKINS